MGLGKGRLQEGFREHPLLLVDPTRELETSVSQTVRRVGNTLALTSYHGAVHPVFEVRDLGEDLRS